MLPRDLRRWGNLLGPGPQYRIVEQHRRCHDRLHRLASDRFLGWLPLLPARRCVPPHRYAPFLRAVQAREQEHLSPGRLLQHRSDDDAGCHGYLPARVPRPPGGEHSLTALTPDQLHALALVAIKLYNPIYAIALAFFGCYDLLIGYLTFKSTFLPRPIGVLMGIAGLGWLTFFIPPIAAYLLPYNLIAGLIGEGSLILLLLVKSVNAQKWQEQICTAGEPDSRVPRRAAV